MTQTEVAPPDEADGGDEVLVRVVVYGEKTVPVTKADYYDQLGEDGLADFTDRTADEIAPRRYLIHPDGYVLDPFALHPETRAALNGPRQVDALNQIIRAAPVDPACEDCVAAGACCPWHIAVAISRTRILETGI